ncbi:phosphotransferase enzyme family protein [Scatolibacter rhodanostii]|uniref:phosphotransferase enzyme family protein n=1 Tax=Scatolibacter rhodanostii TaxID=2014781 RepID=UPI001FA8A8FB|nr:phosphotransferase [Scatolibacter rhodanostii]
MDYYKANMIFEQHLLEVVKEDYSLNNYMIKQIPPHNGGRNLVYNCTHAVADDKVIRVSFQNDRTKGDYLAELEFVRYLHENGAGVANVVATQKDDLLSVLRWENFTFFIAVFEKSKGEIFRERNYQYREGVPIEEYFLNCGKILGQIHQLSKMYQPVHRRYSFFDKYTEKYIDNLVPKQYEKLKAKLLNIVTNLQEQERDSNNYGLVHFDFNDGNYMIDFDTGNLTVFDFDNCCYCPFMFDLASLWQNGVGWTIWEEDAQKRREFMSRYFEVVLKGYRSETELSDNDIEKLPFFISVNLLEMILDRLEGGDTIKDDKELQYFCKCVEEDIPFLGFFSETYSHKQPFCLT